MRKLHLFDLLKLELMESVHELIAKYWKYHVVLLL